MHSILTLSKLEFSYKTQDKEQLFVPHFQINQGQHGFIYGPSGSGKSTLLKLICGTLLAQKGSIQVLSQDLGLLSARKRDAFRGTHMGIIFQQFNLLPFASVLQNIEFALTFSQERRNKVQNFQQEAEYLLSSLKLDPKKYANIKAASLSTGQQQRVAVARALIGSPELIIADEPTSALDDDTAAAFMELTINLAKQQHSTLIMVSHNQHLKRYFDHHYPLQEIAQFCKEKVL